MPEQPNTITLKAATARKTMAEFLPVQKKHHFGSPLVAKKARSYLRTPCFFLFSFVSTSWRPRTALNGQENAEVIEPRRRLGQVRSLHKPRSYVLGATRTMNGETAARRLNLSRSAQGERGFTLSADCAEVEEESIDAGSNGGVLLDMRPVGSSSKLREQRFKWLGLSEVEVPVGDDALSRLFRRFMEKPLHLRFAGQGPSCAMDAKGLRYFLNV